MNLENLPYAATMKRSSLGLDNNPGEKSKVCAIAGEYLEMDNVRIIPAVIYFKGAYDGKKFCESFRIINVGKYPAFIRVLSPTSKAFKMKALPKGKQLCPGMSIIRKVSFVYNSAMAVTVVYVSIYINEKPLLYEMEVALTTSNVKVVPRVLHFGDIDMGCSSEQLSLYLKNEGERVAHFTVDLGRNDLALIVDPMRGSIQPSHTVEVKVEILGSREGNFLKEFWIKTEPLQRIYITGTFIPPQLKIEYPICNFDLIVIDFPKTYYNAENDRILIIRNKSSTNSMFSTVLEYKNEEIRLNQAQEIDPNLNFFQLYIKDGRLMKNHTAAVVVTFAPYRLKSFPQKYAIVFIKIIKINYRDGVIKGKDINVKTFSSGMELDQYQIGDTHSTEALSDSVEFINTRSFLRICLYGEIEEANVKVTPCSIERNNVTVGEVYNLTFNLANLSKHLPITFKYEKETCFEMEPEETTLKPNSSIDILLLLKPAFIGEVSKKIGLALYYKNQKGIVYRVGITYLRVSYKSHTDVKKISPNVVPKYNLGITSKFTNKVGYMVSDVRYNTADISKVPVQAFVNESNMKSRLNEDNSNLIAFPNDRPEMLFPWYNDTVCTTIFANLPRYRNPFDYSYTYTPSELKIKKDNDAKYIAFVRQRRKNDNKTLVPEEIADYPTNKHKVLLMKEQMRNCLLPFVKNEKWPMFIPLSPEELMDIEITPRYVILGKIAPHIVCSDFFEVKNKNEFSVIISIIALSNSVIVKGKKRLKIESNQSEKLYFDCYSHGLGKYYVPVYIIINDYHIFDATVFAEVVPTTVKCKFKEVTIKPTDNVGYLELFNPVNCAIDFAWDVQEKNYEIFPKTGKIESRKSLYCKIVFSPKIDSVFKTEIYLLSQSGAKQIIKVLNENIKVNVKFSTLFVVMENIPLNILVSKTLIIRNESEQNIVLYVKDPNPIPQVSVYPVEAIMKGKGDIFFTISAYFQTVESFNCCLEFVLQDGHEHVIEITGNVAVPSICLEPEFMHIPKIVSGSYQRRVFRLTNTSVAQLKVKFLTSLYPALGITELDRTPIAEETFLSPGDYKELYIEFSPKEPTAYTLYLPYVLNDLVGPPLLNNPTSFKVGTYLVPPNVELTKTIPTLRITCAAGAPWFKFSSFKLYFSNKGDLERDFFIKNISGVSHKIRFVMESLMNHFTVDVTECSGKHKIRDGLIKVALEPTEHIVIKFTFHAESYGTYNYEVPIFVNAYFDNCPFNFIKLFGTKLKPSIETKNSNVCMPTIPVRKTFIRKVTLYLTNHKNDCLMTYICNQEFLKIDMKQDENLELTITFCPKCECNIDSKILIECTCLASCTLYVTASCDNCSLLSYRHKMQWWSDDYSLQNPECTYCDQNDTQFIQKLDRLNKILEKYVYSQGFFSTYFYRIPETIAKYPFVVYADKKPSNKPTTKAEKGSHLPIVTLFKNLSIPAIIHYLADGIHYASTEDLPGTIYDYSIYKNVLKYLEAYDVFVKNLSPELLLTYDRYVIFKTELIDDDNLGSNEILSQEEFDFLSKQCWLDLIIKIYKLMHYDRLLKDFPPRTGKLRVDDIYSLEFSDYLEENLKLVPSDINECEAKLMLWLEFHFKEQKNKMWPYKELAPRKIRDLVQDVRDSLPLATLMGAYCPYLKDVFKDVYFEEISESGHCSLLHNACLISETWNRLGLSFKISTSGIFRPINVEMLFLLSYLYVVLPSFYPLETVTIKSHLGQISSTKIALKNVGPVAVNYSAILFLNENESFQVAPHTVVIPPKSEKDVVISYTAKQIIKEEAVLVLSGETGGQKFSKSMAVNLIGIPDILYFIQEYKIKVEMYFPSMKFIDVVSPYCQSYSANTYFYLFEENKPPLTMKDFVSVTALPKLPRQLEIPGMCSFSEKGSIKLPLNLCFISFGEWIYYIYFINKEVGVFCIKVTVRTDLPLNIAENIDITIQTNFDAQTECKCKPHARNIDCPRVIFAEIPFQNKGLLEGLRRMIQIYAQDDEIEFWNQHLVFSKGFHIFRAYLENTYDTYLIPFKEVLNPTVTYKIIVDGKHFTTEDTVRFEDVTLEGTYKLMLHWEHSDLPSEETLYFDASHGLEPREFHLQFWKRGLDQYPPKKRTKKKGEPLFSCGRRSSRIK